MSKLVVDKLPNGCLECPLLGYLYPPKHSCRNSWRSCPIKEDHPDCLDRFIELKELMNAKTKEVK